MIRARALSFLLCFALARAAGAQLLVENFDDVPALTGSPGWVFVNASTVPLEPWFQGNASVFVAQAGAPGAYVAANFLSSEEFGEIGNWIITPVLPLSGGETLTFYTRAESVPGFNFGDGLSVLLGVGSSTALGNFSLGLVELGPVLGSGPYPSAWQLYTVTIPTVAGMTSGRIGFRYFVEDVTQASFIGLDSVRVAAGAPDADGDGVPDTSDNCATVANADQADGDADAVGNVCDNCTARANPRTAAGFLTANAWATLTGGQRDDDHDGFGNKCDGKFPGVTGVLVGPADLTQFRASNGKNRTLDACGSVGTRPCAIFDLDESALLIGPSDLSQFRLLNGKTPGPKCAACPLTCSAGASGSCN